MRWKRKDVGREVMGSISYFQINSVRWKRKDVGREVMADRQRSELIWDLRDLLPRQKVKTTNKIWHACFEDIVYSRRIVKGKIT